MLSAWASTSQTCGSSSIIICQRIWKAIIRRPDAPGATEMCIRDREGKVLPLTRSEYAICEYLALHAGQTFTKEQIYEAVFGIDGTADDTCLLYTSRCV